MTDWPKQDPASLNAFYGNPDPNHDGVPDRAWEDANLTGVVAPYRMVLAWDPSKPVKTLRVHRKVAPSLSRVLSAILAHYGTQEAIERARMHLYGGGYMFRVMRGGTALSMHSWGCAIDLDPANNAFGRSWRSGAGMMPVEVVKMFEAEGWTWGGPWRTPDAMHFQCANL